MRRSRGRIEQGGKAYCQTKLTKDLCWTGKASVLASTKGELDKAS